MSEKIFMAYYGQKVDAKCLSLPKDALPDRIRKIPEPRFPGEKTVRVKWPEILRFFINGYPVIVPYRIRETEAQILRVFHTNQNCQRNGRKMKKAEIEN